MTFLAILIVVLIYNHWLGEHPLRRVVSFAGYQRWFANQQLAAGLRFVVCLAIPLVCALVLIALIARLPNGLGAIVWLVFSLAVLFYSIDSFNVAQSIEAHLQWLNSLSENDEIVEVTARQYNFTMNTGYRAFQSIYPVIFWFLLLGPMGALIYGLSRRYQEGLEKDDIEAQRLTQVVYWLEWLPVRVSGLIFSLLGNFDACIKAWLENLVSLDMSSKALLHTLIQQAIFRVDYSGAGDISVFKGLARLDVAAFQSLLGRTLYGWLGVAAAMTIIG